MTGETGRRLARRSAGFAAGGASGGTLVTQDAVASDNRAQHAPTKSPRGARIQLLPV
jgi:hypothetical protein